MCQEGCLYNIDDFERRHVTMEIAMGKRESARVFRMGTKEWVRYETEPSSKNVAQPGWKRKEIR